MENNRMLTIGLITMFCGAVSQIEASARLTIINRTYEPRTIDVRYVDNYESAMQAELKPNRSVSAKVDHGRRMFLTTYINDEEIFGPHIELAKDEHLSIRIEGRKRDISFEVPKQK